MSAPLYPPDPPWTPVTGLYLHSGHGHLVSWLTAAQAVKRWIKITTVKPEHERALRARLFRPVPAWTELAAAQAACEAACEAARAAYSAEWPAYCAAGTAYSAARVALGALYTPAMHAVDCVAGCPWNGHTIFAGGQP